MAGKVTASVVESNGSLPPEDELKSHLRADTPMLSNNYGKSLLLPCTLLKIYINYSYDKTEYIVKKFMSTSIISVIIIDCLMRAALTGHDHV